MRLSAREIAKYTDGKIDGSASDEAVADVISEFDGGCSAESAESESGAGTSSEIRVSADALSETSEGVGGAGDPVEPAESVGEAGNLAETVEGVGGAGDDTLITSVTWDSRRVCENSLYVALLGERVDGHEFVCSSIESGARAVLISREPEPDMCKTARKYGATLIKVDDTREAFTRLARGWRHQLRGRVIGLTGSVGKTTTKNIIRDVLATRMDVVATDKNQNNELGVPNTILRANPETQAVIVEMGMRGLGEIEHLCNIARPDWGVVNNVGACHVELLGSIDNVARAKAELPASLGRQDMSEVPESLGRQAVLEMSANLGRKAVSEVPASANSETQTSNTPVPMAFLNAGDEYFDFIKAESQIEERGVVCVAFDGTLEAEKKDYVHVDDYPVVWASDISLNSQGQPSFTLHVKNFDAVYDGAMECALSLRGVHNVSNACATAAVSAAFGMTIEEICVALSACEPEAGRQEILHAGAGFTVINDAYNANPDSMCASLAMLASMQTNGARIAVLGDMAELGSASAGGHERAGEVAAQADLDFLVCVGELAHDIYEAARKSGMDKSKMLHVLSADEALNAVQKIVQPDDIVLVKASHAMQLDRLVDSLVK